MVWRSGGAIFMLTVVPDFSSARILVVGDVMLDRYWSGSATRISPEAPVPVVQVNNIEDRVGGAANVALNIAKLGAKVTLLGVIGDDADGYTLNHLLNNAGVQCDFVVESALHTICKLRVLSQHQQLIRIDFEETPLGFEQKKLAEKFQKQLNKHDVVIFSDYGKGTLSDVANLLMQAKSANLKTLVDPKGQDYTRYKNADLITPNLSELKAVIGQYENEHELIEKTRELLTKCVIENVLLTRGEAGMTLIQTDFTYSLSAQAKDVFDVTGAGDTVIALTALGLAADLSLVESMFLANLAAGIVVGKVGTSTVSHAELNKAMHAQKSHDVFGIVSEDELADFMQDAKKRGEKLVMTNGCFDLLHIGHITYLQQAKALGNRLIVAVNSDESVKQLKGETRPLNHLQERMELLAALECVDWVVAFTEQTPERLYCRLLPDIIVKGGDYKPQEVAGGECVINAGGEVKILPFVNGKSTTRIIEKMKG